jgi:hypothetical protein
VKSGTTISGNTGQGTTRNTSYSGAAREDGLNKAAVKILAFIKREQDRDFWRKLNYTCGKTKGGGPTSVQVPRNGQDNQTNEYTTQSTVHEAIWANMHYKRLYLAEEAPICQGQLQTDFGYNAATRIAADILEGRYNYPDNFNQATKQLCKECAPWLGNPFGIPRNSAINPILDLLNSGIFIGI